MRGGLRGNGIACRLCSADAIEAQFCADVAKVQRRAAFPRKDEIPRGHAGFARRRTGERVILRVVEDGKPRFRRSAHGLKHHRSIRYGAAVFAQRTGAGPFERSRIRERAPLLPRGNGADGQSVYALCAGAERRDRFRRVKHGLRVRHHADGRKPACRGSGASALHVLFVCKTRVAEVHMQVNQPGEHERARRLDAVAFARREFAHGIAFGTDGRNAPL